MKASKFFSPEQEKQIIEAIGKAEMQTSGEIRVHIEDSCKGNTLDCAANIFAKLKMHKTAERNGVLFYLAPDSKQFAILGDAGINTKVPGDFWEKIKSDMQECFKTGAFTQGLVNGILAAGEQLKVHFPRKHDDVNELSNEISFGHD